MIEQHISGAQPWSSCVPWSTSFTIEADAGTNKKRKQKREKGGRITDHGSRITDHGSRIGQDVLVCGRDFFYIGACAGPMDNTSVVASSHFGLSAHHQGCLGWFGKRAECFMFAVFVCPLSFVYLSLRGGRGSMLQRAPGEPSSRRCADLLEHASVARALVRIDVLPPSPTRHLGMGARRRRYGYGGAPFVVVPPGRRENVCTEARRRQYRRVWAPFSAIVCTPAPAPKKVASAPSVLMYPFFARRRRVVWVVKGSGEPSGLIGATRLGACCRAHPHPYPTSAPSALV